MPHDARPSVLLHGVTGPPGSALARWLDRGPQLTGTTSAGSSRLPRVVVDVSGPPELLAAAGDGLPDNVARAEAVAVRLRRRGIALAEGEPRVVTGIAALLALFRARGEASVEVLRADPSLLPHLQAGAWFDVRPRGSAFRRAALRLQVPLRGACALPAPRIWQAAADACFWDGVRRAATGREWQRLTRSSWTALYYHRIAGEGRPGQERMDIAPEGFDRQMRLLRRLRFTALSASDVLDFLADPGAVLPRRAYVLTADDGYLDCVTALRRYGHHRPHVFVPTAVVGGRAHWTDGEPVATWSELAALVAAGGAVGSHSRTHPVLTDLSRDQVDAELAGSRADVAAALGSAPPMLSYPHGRNDEPVRRAAATAGYRIAYTTSPGRNGAGTNPLALRRIGPKSWDSGVSLLWKAITGQLVPPRWERWLIRRARRASRRRRSRFHPRVAAAVCSRALGRAPKRRP